MYTVTGKGSPPLRVMLAASAAPGAIARAATHAATTATASFLINFFIAYLPFLVGEAAQPPSAFARHG